MNQKERSFSIIMTVYDQASELRDNLPMFLTQEYEPGYEVIVIDETSTDETSDVLKLLKEDYPHLYTTFLPKPHSPQIRKKKMAINLGIKASKHDWLIITKIGNKPWAEDVLKVMDDISEKPDVIVVDPPRAGIHFKALPKLLSYGVDQILYISCNLICLVVVSLFTAYSRSAG